MSNEHSNNREPVPATETPQPTGAGNGTANNATIKVEEKNN